MRKAIEPSARPLFPLPRLQWYATACKKLKKVQKACGRCSFIMAIIFHNNIVFSSSPPTPFHVASWKILEGYFVSAIFNRLVVSPILAFRVLYWPQIEGRECKLRSAGKQV